MTEALNRSVYEAWQGTLGERGGSSPDGFVLTDLEHHFVAVSPAYLEMARLPRDGWRGRTPKIVASGLTPRSAYTAMHRDMARTGRWGGEFVNRRLDGTLWWAEWSMVRMDLHGERVGYAGSVRDRTAAYRAEAERLAAVLAEFCDRHEPFIAEHLRRTGEYMGLISREWHRRYGRVGLDANHEELALAARLHDVGKLEVPTEILRKPGPLTEVEQRAVERHAEAGRRYVEAMERSWQAQSPEYLRRLLAFAAEIAGEHHEKWDGTGYPLGRSGEAIPVSVRLFTVVDVYDALRSQRAYKGVWDEARTLRYIREQGGSSFDVRAVDVLLDLVRTPTWQAIEEASAERSRARRRRPSVVSDASPGPAASRR